MSLRRLWSCALANSDLVYRDHMARKQTLKDRALRSTFDEFPMIWVWVYSSLWRGRHPRAHTAGPSREVEAMTISTLFFSSHVSGCISYLGKKKREPCKGSRIWAGNHTEWRLPLSLAINVTTRAGRRELCQKSGWGEGAWAAGGGWDCSPFLHQPRLLGERDTSRGTPERDQYWFFILKQGAQDLISY